MKLYFVFSRVARTNKLGHHGGVISISIVGTADGDNDKELVFSVTMLALPGAMRWTAVMKEQLISQF